MKFLNSLILLFMLTVAAFPQNQKDLTTASVRAGKSAEILKQYAALGTDSAPLEYLRKAKAVAVFPGLTRVNILLSELTIGNGIVALRSADDKWGAPAFLSLKAQDNNFKIADKKTFDVVILFMDDTALGWLKKGDIGFTGSGKKKIALGPVIGGKGADEVMQTANVIYYSFNQGQLIDTGLGNDAFLKAISIFHDNNMNKAIFGMKTKPLFDAPESALKIPAEIEKYRTALTEVSSGAATVQNTGETKPAQ